MFGDRFRIEPRVISKSCREAKAVPNERTKISSVKAREAIPDTGIERKTGIRNYPLQKFSSRLL
jgi:hypothetical protein